MCETPKEFAERITIEQIQSEELVQETLAEAVEERDRCIRLEIAEKMLDIFNDGISAHSIGLAFDQFVESLRAPVPKEE